jgi:hypothetical protein
MACNGKIEVWDMRECGSSKPCTESSKSPILLEQSGRGSFSPALSWELESSTTSLATRVEARSW